MKQRNGFVSAFAALVFAVCFQNCAKVSFSTMESAGANATLPPQILVCDPLSGSNSCDGGVTGEIYYMTDEQRAAHGSDGVSTYFDFGTRAPAIITLPDIFVPTRSFADGFPSNETGEYLSTPDSERLVEWFALKLHTNLVLRNEDQETTYQFALLADDGAVLLNRTTGQVLVDNDGTHPTKLACGTFTVPLSKSRALPLEVQYYQGPRTNIALTLLWRAVPAGGDLSDPLCNQSGNDTFFGPEMNDFSTAYGYGQLLTRGWEPVPAANLTRVSNQ